MAGPPDRTRVKPCLKGMVKRAAAGLKSNLLFDRHFFSDYYAHDIAGNNTRRPLARRIHGFVLDRFYPRPDLVICLNAPAEVLFARKGKGTLALLERRRQEYLHLRGVVKHFATVDATQSEDEVAREVADLIWDFYRAKTGNTKQYL